MEEYTSEQDVFRRLKVHAVAAVILAGPGQDWGSTDQKIVEYIFVLRTEIYSTKKKNPCHASDRVSLVIVLFVVYERTKHNNDGSYGSAAPSSIE
jgi:hypothetical protein